jgi:para-nitrobenzyl esterase
MQPTLNADMYFHDPGMSEDCLTLNVWAPAAHNGEKLPVMVWVYGGGFTTGSTSERRQDGEQIAHRGVILVSMNYRLNIFGFFSHPALAQESPQHAAGNYGLMDQAAALAWVRANIEQFGGDPKNITLFGESAGSFSVSALMASPMSKDLLAHAIGESGGAFSRAGLSFPPLSLSEKQDETFARDVLSKSTLKELRAIPAEDLLKAASAQRSPSGIRFGPNVDGLFLPESVPAIYAAGKQAHIPLLAGWNKDEGAWRIVNMKVQPTLSSYREMAEKTYGAHAGDFLRAYPASTDAEAVRRMKDLAGDQFIADATWEWIEAQVKTGDAPVYRYRFDRGSPGDPNHPAANGAFHSDEIEYVFNVLNSRAGAAWKPEDYSLAQLIQTYWINFARTGNPNGPGLPQWPVYGAADGWQVMHLDATSGARPDTDRDRYVFLRDFAASPQSAPRSAAPR